MVQNGNIDAVGRVVQPNLDEKGAAEQKRSRDLGQIPQVPVTARASHTATYRWHRWA